MKNYKNYYKNYSLLYLIEEIKQFFNFNWRLVAIIMKCFLIERYKLLIYADLLRLLLNEYLAFFERYFILRNKLDYIYNVRVFEAGYWLLIYFSILTLHFCWVFPTFFIGLADTFDFGSWKFLIILFSNFFVFILLFIFIYRVYHYFSKKFMISLSSNYIFNTIFSYKVFQRDFFYRLFYKLGLVPLTLQKRKIIRISKFDLFTRFLFIENNFFSTDIINLFGRDGLDMEEDRGDPYPYDGSFMTDPDDDDISGSIFGVLPVKLRVADLFYTIENYDSFYFDLAPFQTYSYFLSTEYKWNLSDALVEFSVLGFLNKWNISNELFKRESTYHAFSRKGLTINPIFFIFCFFLFYSETLKYGVNIFYSIYNSTISDIYSPGFVNTLTPFVNIDFAGFTALTRFDYIPYGYVDLHLFNSFEKLQLWVDSFTFFYGNTYSYDYFFDIMRLSIDIFYEVSEFGDSFLLMELWSYLFIEKFISGPTILENPYSSILPPHKKRHQYWPLVTEYALNIIEGFYSFFGWVLDGVARLEKYSFKLIPYLEYDWTERDLALDRFKHTYFKNFFYEEVYKLKYADFLKSQENFLLYKKHYNEIKKSWLIFPQEINYKKELFYNNSFFVDDHFSKVIYYAWNGLEYTKSTIFKVFPKKRNECMLSYFSHLSSDFFFLQSYLFMQEGLVFRFKDASYNFQLDGDAVGVRNTFDCAWDVYYLLNLVNPEVSFNSKCSTSFLSILNSSHDKFLKFLQSPLKEIFSLYVGNLKYFRDFYDNFFAYKTMEYMVNQKTTKIYSPLFGYLNKEENNRILDSTVDMTEFLFFQKRLIGSPLEEDPVDIFTEIKDLSIAFLLSINSGSTKVVLQLAHQYDLECLEDDLFLFENGEYMDSSWDYNFFDLLSNKAVKVENQSFKDRERGYIGINFVNEVEFHNWTDNDRFHRKSILPRYPTVISSSLWHEANLINYGHGRTPQLTSYLNPNIKSEVYQRQRSSFWNSFSPALLLEDLTNQEINQESNQESNQENVVTYQENAVDKFLNEMPDIITHPSIIAQQMVDQDIAEVGDELGIIKHEMRKEYNAAWRRYWETTQMIKAEETDLFQARRREVLEKEAQSRAISGENDLFGRLMFAKIYKSLKRDHEANITARTTEALKTITNDLKVSYYESLIKERIKKEELLAAKARYLETVQMALAEKEDLYRASLENIDSLLEREEKLLLRAFEKEMAKTDRSTLIKSKSERENIKDFQKNTVSVIEDQVENYLSERRYRLHKHFDDRFQREFVQNIQNQTFSIMNDYYTRCNLRYPGLFQMELPIDRHTFAAEADWMFTNLYRYLDGPVTTKLGERFYREREWSKMVEAEEQDLHSLALKSLVYTDPSGISIITNKGSDLTKISDEMLARTNIRKSMVKHDLVYETRRSVKSIIEHKLHHQLSILKSGRMKAYKSRDRGILFTHRVALEEFKRLYPYYVDLREKDVVEPEELFTREREEVLNSRQFILDPEGGMEHLRQVYEEKMLTIKRLVLRREREFIALFRNACGKRINEYCVFNDSENLEKYFNKMLEDILRDIRISNTPKGMVSSDIRDILLVGDNRVSVLGSPSNISSNFRYVDPNFDYRRGGFGFTTEHGSYPVRWAGNPREHFFTPNIFLDKRVNFQHPTFPAPDILKEDLGVVAITDWNPYVLRPSTANGGAGYLTFDLDSDSSLRNRRKPIQPSPYLYNYELPDSYRLRRWLFRDRDNQKVFEKIPIPIKIFEDLGIDFESPLRSGHIDSATEILVPEYLDNIPSPLPLSSSEVLLKKFQEMVDIREYLGNYKIIYRGIKEDDLNDGKYVEGMWKDLVDDFLLNEDYNSLKFGKFLSSDLGKNEFITSFGEEFDYISEDKIEDLSQLPSYSKNVKTKKALKELESSYFPFKGVKNNIIGVEDYNYNNSNKKAVYVYPSYTTLSQYANLKYVNFVQSPDCYEYNRKGVSIGYNEEKDFRFFYNRYYMFEDVPIMSSIVKHFVLKEFFYINKYFFFFEKFSDFCVINSKYFVKYGFLKLGLLEQLFSSLNIYVDKVMNFPKPEEPELVKFPYDSYDIYNTLGFNITKFISGDVRKPWKPHYVGFKDDLSELLTSKRELRRFYFHKFFGKISNDPIYATVFYNNPYMLPYPEYHGYNHYVFDRFLNYKLKSSVLFGRGELGKKAGSYLLWRFSDVLLEEGYSGDGNVKNGGFIPMFFNLTQYNLLRFPHSILSFELLNEATVMSGEDPVLMTDIYQRAGLPKYNNQGVLLEHSRLYNATEYSSDDLLGEYIDVFRGGDVNDPFYYVEDSDEYSEEIKTECNEWIEKIINEMWLIFILPSYYKEDKYNMRLGLGIDGSQFYPSGDLWGFDKLYGSIYKYLFFKFGIDLTQNVINTLEFKPYLDGPDAERMEEAFEDSYDVGLTVWPFFEGSPSAGLNLPSALSIYQTEDTQNIFEDLTETLEEPGYLLGTKGNSKDNINDLFYIYPRVDALESESASRYVNQIPKFDFFKRKLVDRMYMKKSNFSDLVNVYYPASSRVLYAGDAFDAYIGDGNPKKYFTSRRVRGLKSVTSRFTDFYDIEKLPHVTLWGGLKVENLGKDSFYILNNELDFLSYRADQKRHYSFFNYIMYNLGQLVSSVNGNRFFIGIENIDYFNRPEALEYKRTHWYPMRGYKYREDVDAFILSPFVLTQNRGNGYITNFVEPFGEQFDSTIKNGFLDSEDRLRKMHERHVQFKSSGFGRNKKYTKFLSKKYRQAPIYNNSVILMTIFNIWVTIFFLSFLYYVVFFYLYRRFILFIYKEYGVIFKSYWFTDWLWFYINLLEFNGIGKKQHLQVVSLNRELFNEMSHLFVDENFKREANFKIYLFKVENFEDVFKEKGDPCKGFGVSKYNILHYKRVSYNYSFKRLILNILLSYSFTFKIIKFLAIIFDFKIKEDENYILKEFYSSKLFFGLFSYWIIDKDKNDIEGDILVNRAYPEFYPVNKDNYYFDQMVYEGRLGLLKKQYFFINEERFFLKVKNKGLIQNKKRFLNDYKKFCRGYL